MRCEDGRERLSRLVDGELDAAGQAGLFGHLEACGECRAFFETLVRARGAVRRDREALLRGADELLPAWPPRPAAAGPAGGRRREPWRERAAAALRGGLPVPAALVLAALLLVAGIGIGAGLAARRGATHPTREAEATKRASDGPRIIYVCSMPEYEVVGDPETDSGD